MMSVPFENLDIHVGRWIVLDEERLYQKIVNERRGGFCFEQNGLFYAMLREMGYEVIRIEANVRHGDGSYGEVRMNHMALLVNLEGKRWIADVGFGDSFTEPLEVDNPYPQRIGNEQFKIEHDGVTGYYWYPNEDGAWEIQYRFFFEAHELGDYEAACHYMQTSPNTHFTQKRVCSKATTDGRVSLSDLRLIERVGGVRTENMLADEDEFEAILWERFGVNLETARMMADRG
jgi:N-hydroxyarylamine O-acetyltransferase